MDSKPIAIIIAVVITIGAMGSVIVTSTNILSGTSSSTDLLLKTTDVISISPNHLEANIQITNQGQTTLDNVKAYLEIDGIYRYNITTTDNINPYETLIISGSAKGPIPKSTVGGSTSEESAQFAKYGIGLLPPVNTIADNTAVYSANGIWGVYSGENVILRIKATTTAGDYIEKIWKITVK